MKRYWINLLPIALAACGGGGESGTSSAPVATVPIASPSPVATATASPSPSPSATPTFGAIAGSVSFTSGTAAAYAVQPDVNNCRTGTLNTSVTTNVVARLNEIRALHRLPAITLSSGDQEAAMQAALMMTANNALSHTPPTSWRCYSAIGAAGAQSSNIYGSSRSPNLTYNSDESLLAGWLTEIDNLVADSVGHRRWLLNPFLNTIAYGRVAGSVDGTRGDAAALKVFNNAGQNVVPGGLPPFVAYPYGDYPAKYFDVRALLSFTVVTDTNTAFGANQNVNFSRATVTVTGPSGTALAVSAVTFDNDGYGVANNIQWKVAGLQLGTNYTVAIRGVTVRGASTDYTYAFRVLS